MAKKFFYMCAGVLMLAVAFHLGATSARGQAAGTKMFVAGVSGGAPFIATEAGDVWRYVPGSGWLSFANIFGGAAGIRTIVSLVPQIALTSTGEVWYGQGVNDAPWVNAGVPPFAPVGARLQSFGALKAKYR